MEKKKKIDTSIIRKGRRKITQRLLIENIKNEPHLLILFTHQQVKHVF